MLEKKFRIAKFKYILFSYCVLQDIPFLQNKFKFKFHKVVIIEQVITFLLRLELSKILKTSSAWLKHNEHEVVTRLNKRADLMTNLEQETAEDVQVKSYLIYTYA